MNHKPRHVQEITVVEEPEDGVTVIWKLGDELPATPVESFGYGVAYYGPDSNGGKRFGVRVTPTETSAYEYSHEDVKRINYPASSVTLREDKAVAHFPRASLGVSRFTAMHGFSQVNGKDAETDIVAIIHPLS